MMRVATVHVGTAALGCPVERSSTAVDRFMSDVARSARKGATSEAAERLSMGTTGKGTTSVVPPGTAKEAALAAEGDAVIHAARPVSRFLI